MKQVIETFEILCGMGRSDDWKKLGLDEEQVDYINEIGYCGETKSGISREGYLNKIHYGDYLYKVIQTEWGCGDFSETLMVVRVDLGMIRRGEYTG